MACLLTPYFDLFKWMPKSEGCPPLETAVESRNEVKFEYRSSERPSLGLLGGLSLVSSQSVRLF